MAIIPDAFTTGFEEHMSTFSQEVRALNPVRIVVMEIHVAGYGLCQFRMLWLEPWEGHLCDFTTNSSFPTLLLCLGIPLPSSHMPVQRH